MPDVKHIIFRGRVQGVGFRWFIRDIALSLGVQGTVKNLPDGTVEAYIQGSSGKIDQLVATAKVGNSHSRLDDVSISDSDTTETFTSFEIRY